jgi:hypothetical protein
MVRNTGACKSSGSGASIDRGVLLIMQDQMPWHFLARCEPQIELRLVAARNPTKFFFATRRILSGHRSGLSDKAFPKATKLTPPSLCCLEPQR